MNTAFDHLFLSVWKQSTPPEHDEAFEEFMQSRLVDFMATRDKHDEYIPVGESQPPIRELHPAETAFALQSVTNQNGADLVGGLAPSARLLAAKLSVLKSRAARAREDGENVSMPPTLSLDDTFASTSEATGDALPTIYSTLYSLKSTPYANSFASRLYGFVPPYPAVESVAKRYIYRDWETQSPWILLMNDLKGHHQLRNGLPEPEVTKIDAPIDYVPLRSEHLPQVHELLQITFWPGIDVSQAVADPPGSTIVAIYKRIVVGIALITPPPDEAYVPYVAVRVGWERCSIGLTMLLHLITANKDRNIILHVSANNPALILYNKLGFKSEEFIVGFYEDYLDPKSKACRNALRLRLRH